MGSLKQTNKKYKPEYYIFNNFCKPLSKATMNVNLFILYASHPKFYINGIQMNKIFIIGEK